MSDTRKGPLNNINKYLIPSGFVFAFFFKRKNSKTDFKLFQSSFGNSRQNMHCWKHAKEFYYWIITKKIDNILTTNKVQRLKTTDKVEI